MTTRRRRAAARGSSKVGEPTLQLGRRGVLGWGALGSLAVLGLPYGARAEDTPPDEPTAGVSSRTLPAGRSTVEVTLPARSFVTLALLGPPHSLLGLSVVGTGPSARALRSRVPLEEDGLLPRAMNTLTADAETLTLIVDVVDPVRFTVAATAEDDDAPPRDARGARRLVGLPTPRSTREGYMLIPAGRYVFARIDVVKSLRLAFDAARKRFDLEPIGVSEASQWDGRRPKSDRGEVRHISHDGGCDVDLALPALDTFPSTVRDHCRRVWLDPTHSGCAAGTAKGVDFERLTYLLGTLCDEAPGRVVKVFMDDVYRREVIRIAPTQFDKKWIKDDARNALSEEGVLVASPWHTDHVHVRFAGEKARALF